MKQNKLKLLAAAAVFVTALPAMADPLRFTVKELGVFVPTGINNLGQVSGWSNGGAGPLAVEYNGSTLSTLGSPTGRSFAYGINDAGQLAGTYGDNFSPVTGRAFSYSNNNFNSFAPAGSTASAINNAGQVVGSLLVDDGNNSHAFVYANNQLTDLSSGKPAGAGSMALGLSNNGNVVGSMWDGEFSEHHAFLYANGVTTDLSTLIPGYSNASAVNDSGQVVLTVGGGPGMLRSYLYGNGVTTEIGALGGDTVAHDINDAGIVVGKGAAGGGFIWQNGVLRDLSSLIDPAAGWTILDAAAINDNNQIAAFGCRLGSCQSLLLNVQAVPEPETYALLGAGLGLVAYSARRRRVKRSVA